MICKNCKAEIEANMSFCPSCGQKNDTSDSVIIAETNDTPVVTINKKKRERVDILGISVPVLFISLFGLVLGFGGYVTPLLLMMIALLLCNVKNKTLTNNVIITLALYATQFVIDTALTFVESIPNKFFAWLMELGNLDFSVIVGKIATAFGNLFAVLDSVVGIAFLVLYVLSIVSLLKSDHINIPFVTKYIEKFIKTK